MKTNKRSPNGILEEHRERERRERDAVIAECEAGSTVATLQAMATAPGPYWKPKPPRATSDSIDEMQPSE